MELQLHLDRLLVVLLLDQEHHELEEGLFLLAWVGPCQVEQKEHLDLAELGVLRDLAGLAGHRDLAELEVHRDLAGLGVHRDLEGLVGHHVQEVLEHYLFLGVAVDLFLVALEHCLYLVAEEHLFLGAVADLFLVELVHYLLLVLFRVVEAHLVLVVVVHLDQEAAAHFLWQVVEVVLVLEAVAHSL